MAKDYLIGLDIGGGGGRCLLLDVATGETRVAHRHWQAQSAADTGGLGFDFDTDMLFARLADATREVIARAEIRPQQVRAIATTAMREGMVVLGGDGSVVLATPNRDARAVGEAIELATERGEHIYRRTGHWPYPIFPAPRLLWLNRRDPQRLAEALAMLSLSEWLIWKLSGEVIAEPTQAGESLLFDLSTRQWAYDLIDELNLPRSLFPAICDAGTAVGKLTHTSAAALGLDAGTAVVVGGADSQCALLGMGVIEPQQWGINSGTTAPVQLITDAPILDPEMRLWSGHHIVPSRWVLESNAGPLGESLEWMARLLYPGSPRPVARLFAEAVSSSPGAAGLLSTVGVEVWNARRLGLSVGSLTLSHMLSPIQDDSRRHVARAIVEGLAFGLRANLEQIVAVTGCSPTSVRLAGGVARNPAWPALLADILEIPIECMATTEASALGAALCAGVGAGLFSNPGEAAARFSTVARCETPAPDRSRELRAIYSNWSALRRERQVADELAGALAVPWVMRGNTPDASPRRAVTRPRILVTADMDEQSLGLIRELGDVEYLSFRDSMQLLAGQSLIAALTGIQVFITEVDIVDAAVLEAAPELRVVAACRSDAVNIHLAACTTYGVPVLHAPGRNAVAVAELTLAFILMHARKLRAATEFLHHPGAIPGDIARMGQAFSTLRGTELWNLVVGLVGFGAVGRQVARRLHACGARVLVADPMITQETAALHDVELVPLEELLEQADVVSLHAAVTTETRGLIDSTKLARMKAGAFLVNTARAALVDEEALVGALTSGHLGGVAVDVFAVEPPASDHPLLRFDNVIATPHVGGNTREVAYHQGRTIAHDLDRLLSGRRPMHVLNTETLERFDWQQPRARPDAEVLRRLEAEPPPAVSDLQRDGGKKPSRSAAATTRRVAPPSPDGETRSRMARILDLFAARIATDDAIRRFSEQSHVTLHFHLNDVLSDLTVGLDRGRVFADATPPENGAEVELQMSAAVFDGMFTGRVNPMQEAMAGRLSFTGDAGKAMTLQQMQEDLVRLYREARATVGDPGDLQAVPPSDAAAAIRPSGGRADEIIHIVDELYASQLITATGGNVSARTEPGSNELWITPSQLFKGELSVDVLVRIDLDGRSLDRGSRSPSSERLMHTAVYRARPEAEAVIHCHAPHATILANTDLPFSPISTEAAFFSNLPRVPFIMPGTPELASAVGESIQQSWAVLMKNHGLLVAGRSLRRAADMAEVIERSAEIMLGCYAVGKEPPSLPNDIVAKLRRMGDMVA